MKNVKQRCAVFVDDDRHLLTRPLPGTTNDDGSETEHEKARHKLKRVYAAQQILCENSSIQAASAEAGW